MVRTLVLDDHAVCVAHESNVLYSHVKEQVSTEHITAMSTALEGLFVASPKGVAALALLGGTLRQPSQEVRDTATTMLKRVNQQNLVIALVLLGEGIFTTIIRMVANTMFSAARMRRTKIFTDLDLATRWLDEQLHSLGAPSAGARHFKGEAEALMQTPVRKVSASR